MSHTNEELPPPTGMELSLNKLRPCSHGSVGDPTIGFQCSPTVGWYIDDDDRVIFTSGLADTVAHAADYTEFIKPIVIRDSSPPDVNLSEAGVLYKKPGDSSLWWVTDQGEYNLTSGLILNAVNSTPLSASQLALSNTAPSNLVQNTLNANPSNVTQSAISSGLSNTPSNTTIKLSENTLYARNGTELIWQTPYGELDLTKPLPDYLELPSRGTDKVVYGFANLPNTGLSAAQHQLISMVSGKPVSKLDLQGMHLQGSLFMQGAKLSVENDNLYVTLSGKTHCLTKLEIEHPINVPAGKSINFGDMSIGRLDNYLSLADSLKVTRSSVICDGKLEIKEQVNPIPSDSNHGVLYKEKNNLMWNSGSGAPYVLNKELLQFVAKPSGDFAKPEFSFKGDLSTGLTRVTDQVVGLTAGGNLTLAVAHDQAILYKPLSLSDSETASPAVVTEGRLYKKAGSNGLFWQTTTKEIDLTQQKWPLVAPDGNARTPSYTFEDSPGCGLYKTSDGSIAVAVNNAPVLTTKTDETTIYGTLKLRHSGQFGEIKIVNGDLHWNDKNLCAKETSLLAVDGTISAPSYSFENNPELGLANIDGQLTILDGKQSVAQFSRAKSHIKQLATDRVEIASEGYLVSRNGSLVWQPKNGVELVIGSPPPKFNGGLVDNPISAPALSVVDYKFTQDDLQRLDISNNGVSFAKLSTDGLQVQSVNLPGVRLSAKPSKLTVQSEGQIIADISPEEASFKANKLILDGKLLMVLSDSLIWHGSAGPVDLTDRTPVFPLQANGDQLAYGFRSSNVGIAKENDNLVLQSENGRVIVQSDGTLQTKAVVTESMQTSTLRTESMQTESLATDLIQVSNSTQLTISAGSDTKFSAGLVQTDGVFRGDNNSVAFGYETPTGPVGISVTDNSLALVTGQNKIAATDLDVNLAARTLSFTSGRLENLNNNLYWKTPSTSVPLNLSYKETITYNASGNVKSGDLVCLDGTGRVFKCLGGRTSKIDGDTRDFLEVYDYDLAHYVMISVFDSTIRFDKITKSDNRTVQTYSRGINSGSHLSVLQTDPDSYVVVYLNASIHVEKIVGVFSSVPVSSSLVISTVGDNLAAIYDSNSDCIIVAIHTIDHNFSVVLVAASTMQLGTVETNISNLTVAETDKRMSLVLIPGGTCLLSYGIVKTVFVITGVNSSVTVGDNFIDYESVDCVSMLYDTNHGVVISLEKTVSGSCYMQVLDVLGLSVQKITSKGFKNASVEPLGLVYNNQSDEYAILSSIGSNIYVQVVEFDGELIKFGLRYLDRELTYTDTPRKGTYMFEIPNTRKLLYRFNGLSMFEMNHQGNPSGYVGLAVNDATYGEPVDVVIKGHIWHHSAVLPTQWLGKKLYINDTSKNYPEYISSSPMNGVFIGTCLDRNKILLGL